MWLRLSLCEQKSRENQVKRFPSSTFGIYGMFIRGRVCLLAVGFDPRQSPIQYRISCHHGGKGTDDSESKHGSGNQPSSISSGCERSQQHTPITITFSSQNRRIEGNAKIKTQDDHQMSLKWPQCTIGHFLETAYIVT